MIEWVICAAVGLLVGWLVGWLVTFSVMNFGIQKLRTKWETRQDTLIRNWASDRDLDRKCHEGNWKAWSDEHLKLTSKLNLIEDMAYSDRLRSHDERKFMLEQAARERRELYSRIQVWEIEPSPAPAAAPDAPSSQPAGNTDEPKPWTHLELEAMGLKENSDGNIIDTRSGALFESVEAWKDYTLDLKKRGLPTNLHPAIVREEGAEAAIQAARSANATRAATAKKAAGTE